MAIAYIPVLGKHWVRAIKAHNAEKNPCRHCVVAIAIRDATKDRGWEVEGDAIRNDKKKIFCYVDEWLEEYISVFDWTCTDGSLDEDMIAQPEKQDYGFFLNTVTGEVMPDPTYERLR